jgi:DNA-binding NarL/FixJ family response regulator
MFTENLNRRILDGIDSIRSVERQISDALDRFASRGSSQEVRRALMPLLETTQQQVDRLERLAEEMKRAREGASRSTSLVQDSLPPSYSRLTLREAQILPMIGEGLANKQIAAELDISIKTVEKHRQHLMEKLGVHDIAGVTRYAISAGVVAATA